MLQVISVVGSLMILSAYGAGQFKLIDTGSFLYSIQNLLGSVILSVIALVEEQWGFLLLEGVWAIISLVTAVRIMAGSVKREK